MSVFSLNSAGNGNRWNINDLVIAVANGSGNQICTGFKYLMFFRFSVAGTLPLLATAVATFGKPACRLCDQPGYAAASGSTSAP
jgi:hypothetical protein